jgi:hypothetical protein
MKVILTPKVIRQHKHALRKNTTIHELSLCSDIPSKNRMYSNLLKCHQTKIRQRLSQVPFFQLRLGPVHYGFFNGVDFNSIELYTSLDLVKLLQ